MDWTWKKVESGLCTFFWLQDYYVLEEINNDDQRITVPVSVGCATKPTEKYNAAAAKEKEWEHKVNVVAVLAIFFRKMLQINKKKYGHLFICDLI